MRTRRDTSRFNPRKITWRDRHSSFVLITSRLQRRGPPCLQLRQSVRIVVVVMASTRGSLGCAWKKVNENVVVAVVAIIA